MWGGGEFQYQSLSSSLSSLAISLLMSVCSSSKAARLFASSKVCRRDLALVVTCFAASLDDCTVGPTWVTWTLAGLVCDSTAFATASMDAGIFTGHFATTWMEQRALIQNPVYPFMG